jgi:hypothetical protein
MLEKIAIIMRSSPLYGESFSRPPTGSAVLLFLVLIMIIFQNTIYINNMLFNVLYIG